MTTTTERGPMEQWLSENKNALFCDGSNVHEDWLDPDEVAAFAREQDARLAACVAALESCRTWLHRDGKRPLSEEMRSLLAAQADEALRRARGETP